MKGKRGVFGGATAGLWLVRKRHCLQTDGREQSFQEPLPANRFLTEASFAPSAAKKCSTLIGWDEELGRPIYDDSISTSSTRPSSLHSDDDDDGELSVKSAPSTSKKKADTPATMLLPKKRTENKNRRGVFGAIKRTIVPVTDIRSSPELSDIELFEQPDQLYQFTASAQSSDESIKSAKDETMNRVAKCADSKEHLSSEGNDNASIFDFDIKTKEAKEQEPDPSEVRQPGHRSSLGLARAFFAQIDSTSLTLETVSAGSEAPSPGVASAPSTRQVRTTRTKLPLNIAKREYRKYCTACRESSVKPLDMAAFLEQRSTYFRHGEVFDGMFEE